MAVILTRRAVLAGTAGASLLGAGTPVRAQPAAEDAVAALEAAHGGRLGVFAQDTASGRRIAYRAAELFPLCSTYKFITVAAVLAEVDRGSQRLDHEVRFTRADLLSYAPVTKQHVEAGRMTVEALCAAAIVWSDNTAANLLTGLLGGPAGWTRYARSLGDPVSRLDRLEPDLNTAIPGDARDTSTPEAMARDLDAVLRGDAPRRNALGDESRSLLEGWMLGGQVSPNLLRAGMPAGWRVADKSGAGENGTVNDVALLLPPRGGKVFAAVYYTGSAEPAAARQHVVAEAGRAVAAAFSGTGG